MPLFRRHKRNTTALAKQDVMADYASRLAYIGNRLDAQRCRSVTILEVSDNYIIRSIDPKDGSLTLTELLFKDFADGDLRISNAPKPSSYESTLKAIGEHLDGIVAANVAIIEGPSAYQVVGWERGHAAGQLAYVLFEATFDRHTIQRMVAEARA